MLTPEAVADARGLRGDIENCNLIGCRNSVRERLICDYFRLVPSDFGAKIPAAAHLLETADKITAQTAIIDALDAALTANVPQTTGDKVLSCKLSKLPHWTDEGRAEFRKVKNLYETAKGGHASVSGLKLIRVYTVEIESMKSNFDRATARLGNVTQDLWHGTKASNLLSILKSGLQIPKSGAAYCTGRMFGDGVYLSTQSTKALNYATSYWNKSGAKNQRTFMFLTEAALGHVNRPKTRAGNLPKQGIDSTWVEPETCGVMNNEVIVYSTDQINLKYLCEFGTV